MPSFIFIDRDGNDLGVILDQPAWQVGDVMKRESGYYRVVEVIGQNLPDIDGYVPIIVERMLEGTGEAA